MEVQALKGARELIKNQKPKLAICIYHLPWDIYKIPMLIKELNCEYKFKIRLHSRGYEELVLYCYYCRRFDSNKNINNSYELML